MGATCPARHRSSCFIGGFALHKDTCAEVADAGYKWFDLVEAP
jgi:hypothetical protein